MTPCLRFRSLSNCLVLLCWLAAAARAANYDVGPGQPLAALRNVPWATLQPGDFVNIHVQPGGYHEKIQISASGTANAHIVIRGIPDPVTGALPIIDGKDAVEDPSIDWRSKVFSDLGVIVVSPRKTGYVYGVTHVSFVDIETLDIRNGLYTADNSITYTDQFGVVRGYDNFSCGIYIEWAHDLAVRGCEISNCGNGLFANSKNLAAQSSARLLIEKNYFHDNSLPVTMDPNNPTVVLNNGYHDHHCYTESVGVIYQYNRFGRLRPGAHGVAIKDRSSGQIIRYNEFDMTEESNVLNLADPQGGSGLIDVQPDYLDSYVYGNLITIQDYTSSMSMIFFGAFNGPNYYAAQHRGTLHFYHNTIVSHHKGVALFFLPDQTYTGTNQTFETVDCRNNIFYADTSVQSSIYNAMYFNTGGVNPNGGGSVVLGKNWISPNWLKDSPNHAWFGALVGTSNLIVGDVNGANNPGFVDVANQDYHLITGANALDAAGPLAPVALPANDVTQQYVAPMSFTARVTQGAAPDLGALESSGAAPVPGPGRLQFSAATYSVNENAGSVTLSVLRVAGTNGLVGVTFATADGTAIAPGYYTATNGTLAWAAGIATPQTFAVTIIDNAIAEPNKVFTVALSNPTGTATLGTPATATVTILDDETVVPENRAPVLPASAIYNVVKLTPLVVTNTATDVDVPAQTLTYELLMKPDGATIDANGIIRWTPATASTNFFQAKVTDNGTPPKSATNGFYVIVSEPVVVPENHAPVLPASAVYNVVKLTNLVVTNTARDVDVPAQTLTYELLMKPDGATIDANGIVRWTPSTASTNFFQAKVTDNGTPPKSATNGFYVIVSEPVVVPENHAPVLPAGAVYNVVKLTPLVVTNTATDVDVPAQTLTYELVVKPDGATIDANGIVRWTPATASTNFFQTKVTDNGTPPKSATNGFYVIVTDPVVVPENHAPVLPVGAVYKVVKLTPLVVTNTATDVDIPAQTLTYELLVKPDGATIDANGIVRWTPFTASTNFFQAKVTDNGTPPRSATNGFYVIVTEQVLPENHAPVMRSATVVTVVKLTEMVFTNTAIDYDQPPQTLTYELLNKPDGATIDADGVIRWTPSATQAPSTNRFRTKVTDNGTPPRSATNMFYAIVSGGNTAPILFGRSSLVLTNPASLSETYTASDSDTPANTLSFNLVAGPAWLAFAKTDETHAQLTGTPPVVTTETHTYALLQVTDNGTPPLSNRLAVVITLLPARPVTADVFATRSLPGGYVPGNALTVTIQANPPAGTTSYAVQDTPPAGWGVTNISNAGQFDAGTGQVRFGPFADGLARTLTYDVMPPANETGTRTFTGSTYKDTLLANVAGDSALIQLHYHPADSSPADLTITTAELSAYVSAWQNGGTWPTEPNPIEVSFVTRAGFLVSNGGTYTVNPHAALPLAWIPTPRVVSGLRVTSDVATVPTGKGCWRFLPPKLAVGAPATVTIILNPGPTDTSYAVEEIPPAGWAVTNVSHAGVYDATSGRVRWGLFQDQTSRTLTYDVTPTGALAPFAGIVSFDGTNAPVAGAREPQVVHAIAEPEFAPVIRLPSGEMILPLSTRFGTTTVIEYSTDLQTWTPIWTNSPGNQLFRDLPLNAPPGRYYRSVEQ